MEQAIAEVKGLMRFTVQGIYMGVDRYVGHVELRAGHLVAYETVEEAVGVAQEMLSDNGNGYMEVRRSAPMRTKYGEPQWMHRGEIVRVLQAPTGPRAK